MSQEYDRTDQGATRRGEVALIFAAMLAPATAMWLSFYGLPPRWTALVYTVSKLVVVILPLWIIRPKWAWPPRPNRSDLLTGLLVGGLVGAATLGVYFGLLRGRPEFHQAAEALQAKMLAAHVTTPFRFVLVAIFISVGNSTLEEYFWRWFAFGRLRRTQGTLAAALLTSLLFGLHHFVVLSKYFSSNWLAVALPLSFATVLGGLIWCWLYQNRGNLYAAWLSHFLIDIAVMVVGYDLLF